MEQYRVNFVDLMLEAEALSFAPEGEYFTLKSGRHSPFFMNAGKYCRGLHLFQLAACYAEAIVDHFGREDYNVVFGPAYKGIPLAATIALEMSRRFGIDVSYSANRKEEKDHGDKGLLLGRQLIPGDRVLIVEDVTTSGASIAEVVPIIRGFGAEIVGEIVSLDRHEKGRDADGKDVPRSALKQIEQDYGFRTASIATMPQVVEILRRNEKLTGGQLMALDGYYAKYGAED